MEWNQKELLGIGNTDQEEPIMAAEEEERVVGGGGEGQGSRFERSWKWPLLKW